MKILCKEFYYQFKDIIFGFDNKSQYFSSTLFAKFPTFI